MEHVEPTLRLLDTHDDAVIPRVRVEVVLVHEVEPETRAAIRYHVKDTTNRARRGKQRLLILLDEMSSGHKPSLDASSVTRVRPWGGHRLWA